MTLMSGGCADLAAAVYRAELMRLAACGCAWLRLAGSATRE